MTTTKTLIEAATLTTEEIRNLLPAELRNFTVDGVPYSPSAEDVATAARAKALYAVADWLEDIPLSGGGPEWADTFSENAWDWAAVKIRELTAAGIERPADVKAIWEWRDLALNLMYLLKAYEAQYTIPPTDKSVAIKGLAERMLR